MAPVRLRHPKGVTTIQVDFDAFTVQDLMQEVYAVSQIPPSLQDRTSTTLQLTFVLTCES
jgi:ubiquitin thioesterase OTU1